MALTGLGVRSFGVTMPLLAPAWTSGALPAVTTDQLGLSLSGGTWRAPLGGLVRSLQRAGNESGVTLLDSAGKPVGGPGTVLSLLPTQELRLARLYAGVLESRTSPLPARPVPRHCAFHGAAPAQAGNVEPGADMGGAATMTIHDAQGMPIDPLAVAATFAALMAAHNPLQHRGLTAPFDASSQVVQIGALAGGAAAVRVRLTDHDGTPRDATGLTGLTAVAPQAGIFTLNAASGGGSDLTGTIGKQPGTGTGGAFPDEARRTLKIGLATTDRLRDQVAFPALPAGVTLPRDFFTVRVVDLRRELLGQPNSAWTGTQMHKPPRVRLNERANLLLDGNDVLGAAAAALTGATTESLAVAPAIDGGFAAPPAAGSAAHWPGFPPETGTRAPSGPVPAALRASLAPSAQVFDDGNAATANTDVVLTLSGLPALAAVRVFNRRFSADAVESRGDGGGGTADAGGRVSVLLRDPFALRRRGVAESAITFPTQAIVHVDVVVVKRTGESRMFGDVTAPVTGTTTQTPAATGSNPFGTATRRSTSPAGVLGLGVARAAAPPNDPLRAILDLTGEGNPRETSRLPGMARRDLLVAGLAPGGTWQGVLAAGRLTGEALSADPRRGAPGGPGGRETQSVGVATGGGPLAYDVARMALRRTTNLAARLPALATAAWAEPAEPAEANGTMAGAVLQTVAPGCETPELSLLQPAVESWPTRPTSWTQIVDWAKQEILNNLPSGLPTEVEQWLRNQLVTQLDNLRNSPEANRLFDEVERELMSSIYGRRDAQWALAGALGRARRFVYIETPAHAATHTPPSGGGQLPAYAVDLWKVLGDRLVAAPGLHVTICTSRDDYPPGFEGWTDSEAPDRFARITGLPTANLADPYASRVVAFHPIGFPGRRARIETTTVIVDDTWALIGSSTPRRRGLSFDGAADLVLSDCRLEEGVSPALRGFRRALMAARLGIPRPAPPPGNPSAAWVRLADGVEAFHQVRSQLRGDGLGTIERLWDGKPVGRPASPAPPGVVNPDGAEYNLIATLTHLALVGASSY